MKATLSMISAVKAVQKSQHLQAAALAEQTFHTYYGADISTLIRMIEAGRFEPVPTLFYEYPEISLPFRSNLV